jgi:hypothetical protein
MIDFLHPTGSPQQAHDPVVGTPVRRGWLARDVHAGRPSGHLAALTGGRSRPLRERATGLALSRLVVHL